MYEARQNKEKVSKRIELYTKSKKTKKPNGIISQLFAIPEGLPALISDTAHVMRRMSLVGGNNPLGGSTNWANETRSAANRKLDEYNLLEIIYQDATARGNNIANLGFGTNVKEQPDVILKGNQDVRAENKYVTGKITQVETNINKAISQLCYSNRSVGYYNSLLIARINIDTNSEAALAFIEIDNQCKNTYLNKWIQCANNCHLFNNNQLRLIITLGDSILINNDVPIPYIENANININENELNNAAAAVRASQIDIEEANVIND